MTFLRRAFDKLVEHEFHWAGALFKLVFWWGSAFLALILSFFVLYRMKGMLASIPAIIQGACLALVVLTVLLTVSMFRERRRALNAYRRFLDAFGDVKPATERERGAGISREKMAVIRGKAAPMPGKPREWWRALEQSMEYYAGSGGDGGWFITRPIRESLSEEIVVDPFYHSAFHQAVPGILTSLGLLATFVAILMALAGVTYNANDPVHAVSGIDQLINGLSGKFLSSIVALVLSVMFTLLEKKVCDRQLLESYDALVGRCTDIFPLLTQTRILLDIQRIALNRVQPADVAERS